MPLTLVSSDGQYRFSVRQREVCRVGRRTLNDVVLDHPTVGSVHCLIDFRDEVPSIRDLGSPSGVWVNERSIGQTAAPLHPGDQVRLGALSFAVTLD